MFFFVEELEIIQASPSYAVKQAELLAAEELLRENEERERYEQLNIRSFVIFFSISVVRVLYSLIDL